MKVYVLERGGGINDGIVGVYAERRLAVEAAVVEPLPVGVRWNAAITTHSPNATDRWLAADEDVFWMTITEHDLVDDAPPENVVDLREED